MKKTLTLTFLCALMLNLNAQVGIGTTSPDSSSILDVSSTNRGFLPPRLTTAERQSIPSPADGLLVYDTDKEMIFVFTQTMWLAVNPWHTESGTTSDVTILTNNQTGRVGIGTATPSEKLEVNGSVKLKGIRFKEGNDLDAASITGNVNANYLSFGDTANNEFDYIGYENNTFVIDKSPGNTTNPSMNITGNITANEFIGFGIFPVGGIIMWSGSNASIPSGWALCNGQTVNGISTPNLSNRFIVASGSSYATNATGGSSSVTLNSTQIPRHSHSVSLTTSGAGGHSHTIYGNEGTGVGGGGSSDYFLNNGGTQRTEQTSSVSNHTHTVSGNTSAYGGTGSGATAGFSIIPPYYSLAFIMRVE